MVASLGWALCYPAVVGRRLRAQAMAESARRALLIQVRLDCYGLLWVVMGCCGLLWIAMGCCGLLWVVVGCNGLLWVTMGCNGLLWVEMGCYGLLWVVMDCCTPKLSAVPFIGRTSLG